MNHSFQSSVHCTRSASVLSTSKRWAGRKGWTAIRLHQDFFIDQELRSLYFATLLRSWFISSSFLRLLPYQLFDLTTSPPVTKEKSENFIMKPSTFRSSLYILRAIGLILPSSSIYMSPIRILSTCWILKRAVEQVNKQRSTKLLLSNRVALLAFVFVAHPFLLAIQRFDETC